MSRRGRSESGFTVVELLLIIVLIIILYRLLVPRYTHRAILKHEVYSTAHALAADIRYTMKLATSGGISGNTSDEYYLKFYTVGTATDTWRIYQDGSEASPIR